MKKYCKNCHFLSAHSIKHLDKISWDTVLRGAEDIKYDPYSSGSGHYTDGSCCFRGKWDTKKYHNLKKDIGKIINIQRNKFSDTFSNKKKINKCSNFILFSKGMTFDAALELQEQGKHRWTRGISIFALVISFVTLIINWYYK
jgi:hypothetical protein